MSQDLFRCGNVSLLVYLLVILFGVSSWVDINGLWVELPILVQNLPEGWDLPSYMAVIIQIANVAPLAYTVASTIYPHRTIEVPVIYLIISTGAVSCLLLAFFWNKTSIIAGTEHSTALFILQFFLALVDCTSSVAFLPFMSLFKPQYMTAYFIGESFSGLIPSVVALAQGAGVMRCVNFSSSSSFSNETSADSVNWNISSTTMMTVINHLSNNTESSLVTGAPSFPSFSVFPKYQPPKFTVQVFFLILMALLLLSALSFTLLNYWSYCKMQYVRVPPESRDVSIWSETDYETDSSITPMNSMPDSVESVPNVKLQSVKYQSSDGPKRQPFYIQRQNSSNGKLVPKSGSDYSSKTSFSDSMTSSSSASGDKKHAGGMSRPKYFLFMALTAWLCALSNGVLPAVQTYSCLPYGIQPYHLAVTLSSIANPLACFASFFLMMTSTAATVAMSVLGTALTGFIMYTVATSPEPPLVDHSMGNLVIILSWVLVSFLLTYTKVAIGTACRHEGRRALLWVGANTQLGSLIGAVVTFLLVNTFKLFQVANPCM